MADLRTTLDGANTDGTDAFLTPGALRQPADALGPRAQRTIAQIMEATRDVFLTRGYAGTTIDEIARVADVSRASFYTYFPSKRAVLIAIGANSASESIAKIARLETEGTTRAGLLGWVTDYFEFLDIHGSFAFAWTQAAQEDEEIRVVGMKRHLRICRDFGKLLAASAGKQADDPTVLGIAASSVLERSWNYQHLYADTIDREPVLQQVTQSLWAMARQSGTSRR
jgi:TetR/AcrR family transcriptional regulator